MKHFFSSFFRFVLFVILLGVFGACTGCQPLLKIVDKTLGEDWSVLIEEEVNGQTVYKPTPIYYLVDKDGNNIETNEEIWTEYRPF